MMLRITKSYTEAIPKIVKELERKFLHLHPTSKDVPLIAYNIENPTIKLTMEILLYESGSMVREAI